MTSSITPSSEMVHVAGDDRSGDGGGQRAGVVPLDRDRHARRRRAVLASARRAGAEPGDCNVTSANYSAVSAMP